MNEEVATENDPSNSRRFAAVQAGRRDPERAERAEGAPSVPPPSKFSGPIPQLNFRVTAVDMELDELNRTEGPKAMIKRADEIEHNRYLREKRRKTREAYERYSILAYHRTIQLTAEKMVAERLAAERAAATQKPQTEVPPAKKPPAPATDRCGSTETEAQSAS